MSSLDQSPKPPDDFFLALPDEGVWNTHKEDVSGDVDVIGRRNGKFLVNVRGCIPVELESYHLVPALPLRVWA